MKVLFLTEFYPTSTAVDVRGGVELRTFYLSQGLAKSHETHVVAIREIDTPPETVIGVVRVHRPGPLSTFRQGGGFIARLRYVLTARQMVRQIQPDRVIAENFLAYAIMLTMGPKWEKKTLLTYADVWVGAWIKNLGFASGMIGEIIERLTLRRKWRHIIAISESTRQKLVQQHITPEHISVVPCGVDLAAVDRIEPIRYEHPTILAVARLVKYKHLDDLLLAVQLVHQKRPDVRLEIIGSGPYRASLEGYAKRLGLVNVIHWRGFVPKYSDVLATMKGASVFCLPSAVEGFGFVTIEAMACHTPYVSSNIAPTIEVTDGGVGGYLYPVGDSKQLAEKILLILSQPDGGRALGQKGRTHVERYDWDRIIPQFVRLVTSV